MRPDFIGIGMERSGTSWLFKNLAVHPGIWMPPIKEIHYFDEVEQGRDFPRLRRHMLSRIRSRAAHIVRFPSRPELYKNTVLEYVAWDAAFFGCRRSDSWYRGLFAERFTKGRVCGEITPAYAGLSKDSVWGVVNAFPGTKFILMLRHPYARLKSGLIHYFTIENKRSRVGAVEMEAWLARDDVRRKSSIARVMENWATQVGEDKLFIGVQNDDTAKAGAFLREVYGFLGVDTAFRPPVDFMATRVNSPDAAKIDIPDSVDALMRDFSDAEMRRLEKDWPHIAKIWD